MTPPEPSLEERGARDEADYAGPLPKICRCTRNKERKENKKKTKAVACKFNITGAKLYIY
jgi:hypothetical protein